MKNLAADTTYAEVDALLAGGLRLKGNRDYSPAITLFNRALELLRPMAAANPVDDTIERIEDAEEFIQRSEAQQRSAAALAAKIATDERKAAA